MNLLGLFLLVVILGLVIYLVYNSRQTQMPSSSQGCSTCGPRLPPGSCNPCARCNRCRPCGCGLQQ